jgi:YD repeat-containing protein
MTYSLKLAALIYALTMGGCIFGCTDSARHQFGYTEPGIRVTKGILGASVDVSSNISGHVELVLDPSGKVTGLKADLTSGVTDVYDAQGRRINENFLKGRALEYDFKVAAVNAVGQQVSNVLSSAGQMLLGFGAARSGSDGQAIMQQGLSLLQQAQSAAGIVSPDQIAAILASLQAVVPRKDEVPK